MPDTDGFTDLEIRILPRQVEGYPIELTLNRELEYRRGFIAPSLVPWVEGDDPKADGERLFACLVADDRIKAAWAEVRGRAPQRRLRLRLDAAAPELHTVPWELLRDPGGDTVQDIGASAATPFSRYLAGQWQPGSPILKRPIRILVAVANPANLAEYGLAALDVALECAALADATHGLPVEVVPLPQPCTLPAIEAALKQGGHILHFVGHGSYSERTGAVLYLADDRNAVTLARAEEIAAMLALAARRRHVGHGGQAAARLPLELPDCHPQPGRRISRPGAPVGCGGRTGRPGHARPGVRGDRGRL